MASAPSLSILEASPEKPAETPRCKFRVRYRKAGDLRLVSHHDLMHVCERMFRRANLDVPVTQGFNPRPKMWFASAIALGVAGLNEVLEFELSQVLSNEEVQQRLTQQAPPGMAILSVRAIDVKTSARVRRALYRLALPAAALSPQAINAFMEKTEHWVERLRPRPRRINIRPFVHELRLQADRLDMALWITPNGAARPEEVVTALGLGDLVDNGAVIERTDLEIFDELPADVEEIPLIESAIEEISVNDKGLPQERPTAIGDNPMSFDS